MIDRNHPAVEAMLWHDGQYVYDEPPENWPEQSRNAAAADYADKIEHILPHLTADDLRDTPTGKQLLAEGWDAALHEASTELAAAYPEDIWPEPDYAQINHDAGQNTTARVAAAFGRHLAQTIGKTPNPYREEAASDGPEA